MKIHATIEIKPEFTRTMMSEARLLGWEMDGYSSFEENMKAAILFRIAYFSPFIKSATAHSDLI